MVRCRCPQVQPGRLAACPRPWHSCAMSTLTEIEAAAAKLPRREQRQLHAFLTKQLKPAAVTKAKAADPLAGLKAHWRRIEALTGGKPVLTRRAQERFNRALR